MNAIEDGRRIQNAEEDIKNLQEAIYGDRDYVGLVTRMNILETRLQIFWWALAGVGSTAIALVVRAMFKVLEKP